MKTTFSSGLLAAMLAVLPLHAASLSVAAPAGPRPEQHGAVQQHTTPGYLGIDVKDVSQEQIVALKLRDARGAEIIRVDHDGPAGKMGLRERDVVLQMNGAAVENEEGIRRMLRDLAPGKAVVMVINRDGQQLTVTAQMADRSEVERQAWERHLSPPAIHGPQAPATGLPSEDFSQDAALPAPSGGPSPTSRYSKSFLGTLLMTPSYTGITLERLGTQLADFFGVPNGSGLLVRSVENNSPAAMAGIRAGDVVMRANARTLSSMTDWARTIRDAKGRPVTVIVLRDRQEKTLTLTPDGRKRSALELPAGLGDAILLACLPSRFQP